MFPPLLQTTVLTTRFVAERMKQLTTSFMLRIPCTENSCLPKDPCVCRAVSFKSPNVHALFVKVHALFVKVHALFVKVHPLFVKVHALFVKVHALFVKVHALFVKVHAQL